MAKTFEKIGEVINNKITLFLIIKFNFAIGWKMKKIYKKE